MTEPRCTTDPDGTTRTVTADSPKGLAKAAEKETNFQEALATFIRLTEERVATYFAEHYENLKPPRYHADPRGKKYVRIVREDRDGADRGVHVFVERATGLIWFAKGWKGPALNRPRGSIYGDDPLKGTTVWGGEYLR